MPVISDQEAEEFVEKVKEGQKLIDRGKKLLSKKSLSKQDKEELAAIQNRLNDLNNWFNETGRF